MPLTAQEISDASQRLEGKDARDILAWSFARFPGRIGISTAFGAEGCVLIDLAVQIEKKIPVFYIDTGFAFAETNALKDQLEQKYGIAIDVYRPLQTVEKQAAQYGDKLYDRDPDKCCALRKVEPMQRALKSYDAWVSARRRDMASTRTNIPILELVVQPDGREMVKVNPLANWNKKDVWGHLLKHAVPYNPLYDQGFASIGCWPCTRAIQPGEDERAGRWAGKGKTECGIHTFMDKKA